MLKLKSKWINSQINKRRSKSLTNHISNVRQKVIKVDKKQTRSSERKQQIKCKREKLMNAVIYENNSSNVNVLIKIVSVYGRLLLKVIKIKTFKRHPYS